MSCRADPEAGLREGANVAGMPTFDSIMVIVADCISSEDCAPDNHSNRFSTHTKHQPSTATVHPAPCDDSRHLLLPVSPHPRSPPFVS